MIGGWRPGATQRYASGTPLSFSGGFGFPGNTLNNRPTITTYDGWRASIAGDKFGPNVDRYFQTATLANGNGDTPTITQQSWFPLQLQAGRNHQVDLAEAGSPPRVRNITLQGRVANLTRMTHHYRMED